MQITDLKINLNVDSNSVIAYCNMVLDFEFVVRDLRVIRRHDGSKLLVMPSRKNKLGEWVDVCHPINKIFRKKLEDVIFSQVQSLLNQKNGKSNATAVPVLAKTAN